MRSARRDAHAILRPNQVHWSCSEGVHSILYHTVLGRSSFMVMGMSMTLFYVDVHVSLFTFHNLSILDLGLVLSCSGRLLFVHFF